MKARLIALLCCALLLGGVLGAQQGPAWFVAAVTGTNLVTAGNSTAGTGNYGGYWLKNDEAVNSSGGLIVTSSTYNTAPSNAYDPMNVASATQLLGPRSGGLILNAENGAIGFYTAHVKRWGINAAGDLTNGTGTTVRIAGGSIPSPVVDSNSRQWAVAGSNSAFYMSAVGNVSASGTMLVVFDTTHPFSTPPVCVATPGSTALGTVVAAPSSTTGVTIVWTGGSSNPATLSVICFGNS